MPIKLIGGTVPEGTLGDRQVSAVPVVQGASPPIQLNQWFRNSLQPDAQGANLIAEAANSAVLWRSRQVFSGARKMSSFFTGVNSTSSDRARWRFAFKSSKFTHAIVPFALMSPPNAGYTTNSRARLDIFTDVAESTLSQSVYLNYGMSPIGSLTAQGYQYLRAVRPYVEISPDTDYYCRVVDVDYGLILSISVFELCSLSENGQTGYLAVNNTSATPVTAATRRNAVTISNDLWRYGGATVLTWSVNDGTAPVTNATTTEKNLLDTAVTSISASAPGWTIDMTGKDRLSQTSGVPCVLKVFGSASGNEGNVYLKNSSGTTITAVNFPGGGPNWEESLFDLPAIEDTYYLMFAADAGGTVSVYAASLHESE